MLTNVTKLALIKETIMTLKNCNNPNHPKKGTSIGVNNGLRTGDLLKFKVKDVKYLKTGDTLEIIESKTGKRNILIINKTVNKYTLH